MIRSILFVTGIFSLTLGVVGIFLPLLPTTPFVLLSAWCFMRSSPKFHAWLIAHPTFGPIHEAWTRRGAIPTSAKRTSVIMISLSAGTIWAWVDPLPVKIGLTILLAGVSLFVLTRPS